jgi:glycerol-3-phosphate dehydrogenase (NAD(P)+)
MMSMRLLLQPLINIFTQRLICRLPNNVLATTDLKKAIDFAEMIVLAVPTKVIRMILKQINPLLNQPVVFTNVAKGIEPGTLKRISEIVFEEIDALHLKGFVALTGPSHAEESALRKLTLTW